MSPRHQQTVMERLAAAGASSDNVTRNVIGHGMGAPTVLAHGTEEQRRRWLRPLFTAEEIWCQLFSEPGAGSDVAALATRAVRDGDEWVINGQKVWTTLAHTARWGLLVARTDPDVPKHRGLTYFVIDMDQPGVEVRGLHQITGEAEFNEVFFSDARVPDAYRLGDVGEGWRVSMTTLMNERVAIGSVVQPQGLRSDLGRSRRLEGEGPHRRGAPRRTDRSLDRGRGATADQPPGHREPAAGDTRTRGLDIEAPLGRTQQADHGIHRVAARRRGLLYPKGTTSGDPSGRGSGPLTRNATSSGRGPTRSRAGHRRSCGTSSASGSSAFLASPGATRTSPGRTYPAAELDHPPAG